MRGIRCNYGVMLFIHDMWYYQEGGMRRETQHPFNAGKRGRDIDCRALLNTWSSEAFLCYDPRASKAWDPCWYVWHCMWCLETLYKHLEAQYSYDIPQTWLAPTVCSMIDLTQPHSPELCAYKGLRWELYKQAQGPVIAGIVYIIVVPLRRQ